MNVEKNPTAHEEFQAAIAAKLWPEALAVLAAHGVKARPSQAPELRTAVRANPALIARGQCVTTATGAMREIEPSRIFEPEWDKHGAVVADWLTDPVRLEDSIPHFSTNWKAEHRIKHHLAFGETAQAVNVLREFGLSARIDDFDGELHHAVTATVHQRHVRRDGGTIAIDTSN